MGFTAGEGLSSTAAEKIKFPVSLVEEEIAQSLPFSYEQQINFNLFATIFGGACCPDSRLQGFFTSQFAFETRRPVCLYTQSVVCSCGVSSSESCYGVTLRIFTFVSSSFDVFPKFVHDFVHRLTALPFTPR